ncbi:hypothetical protein NDU88_001716 [Pleurodeles waltl]|uniref:Uncharacterized protein n=1 Tax=Pleurodeles waltl TaxID=8319 RepID=A0AAV7UTM2_PLEWA|nr:hypothetical protein NDU88_001716 [Pleurodeles waltl]
MPFQGSTRWLQPHSIARRSQDTTLHVDMEAPCNTGRSCRFQEARDGCSLVALPGDQDACATTRKHETVVALRC